MSEAMEMIHRAKEIHDRLMYPPNAVNDTGINLRRNRLPPLKGPPAPKEEPKEVLEHHLTAKVDIIEIPYVVPKRILKISAILKAVCNQFSISIQDLKGIERKPQFVLPRHVAIYLARQHSGLSSPIIGKRIRLPTFPKMDHASVLHANTNIAKMIEKDSAFAGMVGRLESILFAGYYDPDQDRPLLAPVTKSDLAQPGEAGLSGC